MSESGGSDLESRLAFVREFAATSPYYQRRLPFGEVEMTEEASGDAVARGIGVFVIERTQSPEPPDHLGRLTFSLHTL